MDIAATARFEFRFLKSLMGATVVTMALLYFMHALIAGEEVELEEEAPPIVDVVAIPQIIKTIVEDPELNKVVEPLEIPPAMPREVPDVATPEDIYSATMVYEGGHDFTAGGIGISVGGVIQQVMVPPSYPQRALMKGIEGFVEVEFYVTAAGSTDHVKVLQASPQGVFEKAAMRAVKRWKYLPDEERKGNPVMLRERIRFAIQD